MTNNPRAKEPADDYSHYGEGLGHTTRTTTGYGEHTHRTPPPGPESVATSEAFLIAAAVNGFPEAVIGCLFSNPLHRSITDTLRTMRAIGDPIDFATVLTRLEPTEAAALQVIIAEPANLSAMDGDGAVIAYHQTQLKTAAHHRQLSAKQRELSEAVTAGDLSRITSLAAELVALVGNVESKKEHRSILELRGTPPDPSQTLLGERFLCRRGTLLLVGPSGVGKSSMSMQQDICWSLGRPAFGVEPNGPLRILTIQAENDDGDLYEMADGVINALNPSRDDLDIIATHTNYQTLVGSSGSKFISELDALLTEWPADIVRVDPLFAFFGGKIEDTESLGNFLRGGLNPIIHKHNCGLILAHHTPKTNNQDRSGWTHVDYSYAGAGSAELTNWARSLVVLEATHTPGTFKMIAAKRGARVGWRDPLGDREFIRYYRHSKRDGVICWEEGDGDEVERDAAAKRSKRKQAVVDALPIFEELVTPSKRVEKSRLLDAVNQRGVGVNAAMTKLRMLLDATEPEFFQHREKREGTRPRLFIARYPQPTE